MTIRREPKPVPVPADVAHDDWLAQRLRDPELAADYLNAALAEDDQAAFMLALRDVARARGGIAAVARLTGLNRVSLNRALSLEGNPELQSLRRILAATGLQLAIVRAPRKRDAGKRQKAAA